MAPSPRPLIKNKASSAGVDTLMIIILVLVVLVLLCLAVVAKMALMPKTKEAAEVPAVPIQATASVPVAATELTTTTDKKGAVAI